MTSTLKSATLHSRKKTKHSLTKSIYQHLNSKNIECQDNFPLTFSLINLYAKEMTMALENHKAIYMGKRDVKEEKSHEKPNNFWGLIKLMAFTE